MIKAGVVKTYSAPTYSGGDFFPPADGTYDLGGASAYWDNIYVNTVVVGTAVAGDWLPSADDTYDLGEATTPLEWKDLYIDGIAYIDAMSVPEGFTLVSEGTVHSYIKNDTSAWDIFTKAAGASALSRFRIPTGADVVDIAMANANLLFGHEMGIRTNAANGTVVHFDAYENGAYVTVAAMNSSATEANWVFYRPVTLDGLVISNDGTVTTIISPTGDYTRIGDAAATSHSLASEDDLMVSGILEVDGTAYLDALTEVATDQFLRFGGATFIQYQSDDTNARAITMGFTTPDATHVPVFQIGLASTIHADLGMFDGYTTSTVAIFNDTADAFSSLDAGDVNGSGLGLYFHPAADEDVNIISLSVTGTPSIIWDESADAIVFNANLGIGTLEIDEDSGAVTLVDMSVSATPADGTEESIAFAIDGGWILKLYSEADSAGAVDTQSIICNAHLELLKTDTDGTREGQIWYDASEDKLKFKTAGGVETITSAA
jgi:hypothetical protein